MNGSETLYSKLMYVGMPANGLQWNPSNVCTSLPVLFNKKSPFLRGAFPLFGEFVEGNGAKRDNAMLFHIGADIGAGLFAFRNKNQ